MIQAWVPQTGRIGLGLSILSYNNQVSVGFNVDLKVIPDPDVMLALFDEELAAFFALLREHAMMGFYGDPRHGGNKERVSWKMLGVPDPPVRGRLHETPPPPALAPRPASAERKG